MQNAFAHPDGPRRSIQWVTVGLTVLLVVFGFLVYGWMQKDVTILVDGKEIHTKTFKDTVGDVLDESEVKINSKDQVEPGIENALAQEQVIKVTRAFWVSVEADGKVTRVETLPATVGEVLSQAQVVPGEKDVIEPELETELNRAATVRVSRITEEIISHKQKIAFRTEQKQEHSLERGIHRVVSPGKEGLKEEKIKITYKDGKPIHREVIETTVLAEPVSRVVAFGVLQYASRGGHRFEFDRVMKMTASAYTHTGKRTRTGSNPKVGTVAVDPSVIKLGSKIYVDGYGFGIAEDTGGSIKGNRIDVFLETEAAARRWGMKSVKVYLIK